MISRLITHGIISRREVVENTSKAREPLIAFCVRDLKLFFNLCNLYTPTYRGKALGVSGNYLAKEMKKADLEQINDQIAMKMLRYYNQVMHWIPDDLPQKIISHFVSENNQSMPQTLSQIQSLYDDLTIENVKDFWMLTGYSATKFSDIFSNGEIPPDMSHARNSSVRSLLYETSKKGEFSVDRAFRLWLAFAFHLNLVDKAQLIENIDKLSMADASKFEHLRTQFFEL